MKIPFIPALVIGVLLAALAFWTGTKISGSIQEVPLSPEHPLSPDMGEGKQASAYLYFVDPSDQYLFAENRPMRLAGAPAEKARALFDALMEGPAGQGASPLPKESAILAFYMDGDTAVMDLHPAIRDNHPGGSHAELHTIYALVNSLVINIPEIRRVKLLIAGQEQDTLAGHIDIRHPLTANMMIVR